MKILIYGAGVIGSLYAVLFSKNKTADVSIYARGTRFEDLCKNGLRYCDKGSVKAADVRIVDTVKYDDNYDYIFLTVRENQLYKALEELRGNISRNIVTMVNSLDKLANSGYNIFEISDYANKAYDRGLYDEVYTEYRTLKALKR